jgi:DnaK suppressor protein
MKMTPRQREQLKVRLVALRDSLIASGPRKIEPTRTDAASVGVPDEDQQALTEMLQVLASQQNKKQSEVLGKVSAALRVLDETPGSYGACEDCGEPIAFKRLLLMPYVSLCTACQAERDPRRGTSRKSLTDFGE